METIYLKASDLKDDQKLQEVVDRITKEVWHNIEIERMAEEHYEEERHKTKVFSKALKTLMGAKAPVNEWSL